jgi:hypothetical protein
MRNLPDRIQVGTIVWKTEKIGNEGRDLRRDLSDGRDKKVGE